jgi:hypothetical protein
MGFSASALYTDPPKGCSQCPLCGRIIKEKMRVQEHIETHLMTPRWKEIVPRIRPPSSTFFRSQALFCLDDVLPSAIFTEGFRFSLADMTPHYKLDDILPSVYLDLVVSRL